MIYTTLNRIRKHRPCRDGWRKLLTHLDKTQADDEPLALAAILESNGIEDALWCLRAVDGHETEMRLYAVWCARQVQHLMKDPRSLAAIDVAERHANGQATDKELTAARDAAWDAASAAARAAARAASWYAAWYAASAAARAARGAASAAASAAAWAARASGDAAGDAAGDASWDAASAAAWEAAGVAAREAQIVEFRRVFCQE